MKKIFLFILLFFISLNSSFAELSNKEIILDKNSLLKASNDYKNIAYVSKKDWKDLLILNNKEIGLYDKIISIIFSPDSKNYSYIAIKDWKYIVVKDWVESNKYDKINDYHKILYSPDSKSYSYIATKDWKDFIVKDWIEWNKYDKITYILYSPDSKSFIYVALKNWKYIVVKDWVESIAYDNITNLLFSPDSKSFAYKIRETDNVGNTKDYIIKDWKKINKHFWIDNFMFSPDSKSFVYVASNHIDWYTYLIKDDKELYKTRWSIPSSDFWFSSDWKKFAYVIRDWWVQWWYYWKHSVVLNWIKGKTYEQIYLQWDTLFINNKIIYIWVNSASPNDKYTLVIDWKEIATNYGDFLFTQSLNWKNFAYVLKKDWKYIIIKDWVQIWNLYDNVSKLIFSPDWKWFSYIAEKDWKYFVVRDWIEWDKFNNNLDISNFIYSSNSKSLAYSTNWDIYLDWEKISNWNYDIINSYSLIFSPDSNKLTFSARNSDNTIFYQYKNKTEYEKKIEANVDKIYNSLDKQISSLSKEKQLEKIKIISLRIDKALNNKISEKNKYILNYLNSLLYKKINELE